MNTRNTPKTRVINTRNSQALTEPEKENGFRYIRVRALSSLRCKLHVGDSVRVVTNRTNGIGTSLKGKRGVVKEIKRERWLEKYRVQIGKKSYLFTPLEIQTL
jgi:hypothetical protein